MSEGVIRFWRVESGIQAFGPTNKEPGIMEILQFEGPFSMWPDYAESNPGCQKMRLNLSLGETQIVLPPMNAQELAEMAKFLMATSRKLAMQTVDEHGIHGPGR